MAMLSFLSLCLVAVVTSASANYSVTYSQKCLEENPVFLETLYPVVSPSPCEEKCNNRTDCTRFLYGGGRCNLMTDDTCTLDLGFKVLYTKGGQPASTSSPTASSEGKSTKAPTPKRNGATTTMKGYFVCGASGGLHITTV